MSDDVKFARSFLPHEGGTLNDVEEATPGDARELAQLYLAANAALERVGELLSENGCDCDCDHSHEDHEDDCERCLACRIDVAMKPRRS